MWPLAAATATATATATAQVEARLLSELRDVDVPFWAILLAVAGVIFCILCGGSCFVVWCFTTENHLGQETEINSAGKRWLRPLNAIGKDRVAYERYEDPHAPVQGGAVDSGIYRNRAPGPPLRPAQNEEQKQINITVT